MMIIIKITLLSYVAVSLTTKTKGHPTMDGWMGIQLVTEDILGRIIQGTRERKKDCKP